MRLRSGHVLVSICVVGLTFVAVAILMGTSVFTGNTAWEVGMPPLLVPYIYVKESVPVPVDSVAGQTHEEVKAQDSQGNAGNPLPFREPLRPDPREEQSDALSYQSMEQMKVAREANDIAREDKDIQAEMARIGWRTIWSQVALALVQFFFIWTANQHAAAAALAAKESVEIADRSMRIANRAYLFVADWEVVDFREGTEATVKCHLTNAGHTPAVIKRRNIRLGLTPPLPPPLSPTVLKDKEEIALPVNPQGDTVLHVLTPHLGIAEFQKLRGRTQSLYVSVCFVYSDVFDEEYWVVSSATYDIRSEMFAVVDDARYNCHGTYRKEEWEEKNTK